MSGGLGVGLGWGRACQALVTVSESEDDLEDLGTGARGRLCAMSTSVTAPTVPTLC